MASKKNDTANESTVQLGQIPDVTNWTSEEIGFAPHWNPAPGERIYAAVEAVDRADPEFPRFLLRALAPVKAFRGSADSGTQEPVEVETGGQFSMSVYHQLAPKFEEYLSYPFVTPMVVIAKEKIKGGKGNVWLFEIKVAPETRKALQEARVARRVEAGKHNAQIAG